MWWLWLLLIIAVAGYFIYRTDKKIKAKFNEKFSPDDWDLPRSPGVNAETKTQAVIATAPSAKLDYIKTPSVFSDDYRHIFNALYKALDDDYMLLANINAADVLQVKVNGNPLAVQVATKNIAAQQFDFVVCDKNQLTAVCAIVVGETLEPMLVNACEGAQLPLARFSIQSYYDIAAMRASLLKALGRDDAARASTFGSTLDDVDARAQISLPTTTLKTSTPKTQDSSATNALQKNEPVDNATSPLCPTCSGTMVKRKAKTGAASGKLFWICSNYPECRGVLAIK